nr:hypothetical protein [Tanacetum cinerariifolium]
MDPNSSVRKTCLGENVIDVLSEKAKGHGDWNFLEYQDTANSGGKKEMMVVIFHKMDISSCFINGLEAYDDEINLGTEENMISNEFAVKLCLNHEEDDVEPRVVLGRSFMRVTKDDLDLEMFRILKELKFRHSPTSSGA